jgi:tetratricopeptide (TPR) repeat protein
LSDDTYQKAKAEGYEEAVSDFLSGSSVESIRARLALKPDRDETGFKKVWKWLGENLTSVTGLVVAISGLLFSYFQYQINTDKNELDLKVSKAEIINKLSTSITNEDIKIRTLAISTLIGTNLFKAEDIVNLADIDVLINLSGKINDVFLQKKVSVLLAEKAETLKDTDAVKSLELAQKAVSFYPVNAQAKYRLARFSQAAEHFDVAITQLNQAREDLKDAKNVLANTDLEISINERLGEIYNRLYGIYGSQEDRNKAVGYFQEAKKSLDRLRDKNQDDLTRMADLEVCIKSLDGCKFK